MIRVWTFITGVVALAGLAGCVLFSVQVLGPHGRRPRDGAAREVHKVPPLPQWK
jgi:hypothetical protein